MKRNMIRVVVLVAATAYQSGFAAEEVAERQAAAKEAAGDFVKQLGGALKEEMAKGGPAASVRVCTHLAPEIAGRLSRERGWPSITACGRCWRISERGQPRERRSTR